MNWSETNKSNKFFLKKKSKAYQEVEGRCILLKVVEDENDWSKLNWVAAEGTKKGFKKAKKISRELVLKQNGKIIVKKHGRPSKELTIVTERKVTIGDTTILDF